MEAFTVHPSGVCLQTDDLEGLNTLYPSCSEVVLEPNCLETELNYGNVRAVIFVVLPFLFSLIISIVVHTFVDRYEDKKLAREKAKNLWLRGNVFAKGEVAKQKRQTALAAAIEVNRGRDKNVGAC